MIRILKYGEEGTSVVSDRREQNAEIARSVSEIIADVRSGGDAALLKYSEKFDGVRPSPLEATKAERESAMESAGADFIGVLRKAASNIEAFHRRQIRTGFVISRDDGVMLGQRVIPLERVGLYIPGGTASYPSSVLMNCIPARLAGVGEIIIATPPARDGSVNPDILAAAEIAGADRIFKIGGAQAVAALAYGTESVPRVDKIVGPGNAYVAEAKRQVFGHVAIDMIAGPSEILVIADGKSRVTTVAADMLSQAEHDRMARAILITDSVEFARAVAGELERQISQLPRRDIARASIDANGLIVIAESIVQAVSIANDVAPEHLELCVDNPFDYLGAVRNAGSVFLGRNCPEALGDYFAGPNHTLPTSGTARFSSPLSVDDFIKKSSFTYYTGDALERDCGDIAFFAEREGLSGHARSVTGRFDSTRGEKK